MRASKRDARQNAFVVAIFRNTSPVYSVVQADGEAAHRYRSKWRHGSVPKHQSSTAEYRPPVQRTGTSKAGDIYCPGKGSGRYADHPRDENRHFSPRQMISIPERRVTVRHPCSKRRPVRCGTWPGVNVTPADQPPGRCGASAAASRPRSAGQPTG